MTDTTWKCVSIFTPPAVSDCEITSSSRPVASDVVKLLQASLLYFEKIKIKNLDPIHILHLKNCIRAAKDEEKKSKRQTTPTQYLKKL